MGLSARPWPFRVSHILGLQQGCGLSSQQGTHPPLPVVVGELPQALLLPQGSALLSARVAKGGCQLLLAFPASFLGELINILLYFLHNHNSAAQGKPAQGKRKRTDFVSHLQPGLLTWLGSEWLETGGVLGQTSPGCTLLLSACGLCCMWPDPE